jgi:hypothetical protein
MAPWTPLWERNYFAELWPWLDAVMGNNFVKGAVTGVGLITAWAGVKDLSGAFMARWSATK